MAIITATIQSRTLQRKTTFAAIIPTKTKSFYDPQKGSNEEEDPLKTLYLLHGWDGDHQDWLHNTRIVELADKYRFAVIMPNGENGFFVDNPGANRYGAFLTDELVEETQRLFPLSHKREDTWIGGLSMGGYGALRNGLQNRERFGKIAAFSSAILKRMDETFSNPGPEEQLKAIIGGNSYRDMPLDMDVHWLAGQAAPTEPRPEIYLTCGTDDFLLEDNRTFHEWLNRLNYPHAYRESSGAHDWDYWNNELEPALKWLTGVE